MQTRRERGALAEGVGSANYGPFRGARFKRGLFNTYECWRAVPASRSDEKVQQPIDRGANVAMALQDSLQYLIALRSIERQNPGPDLAAGCLRDETADAAKATGAFVLWRQVGPRLHRSCERVDADADVAIVSITGTSHCSVRSISIARN